MKGFFCNFLNPVGSFKASPRNCSAASSGAFFAREGPDQRELGEPKFRIARLKLILIRHGIRTALHLQLLTAATAVLKPS